MIPRILESELLAQMKEFPIVTVLGPRQAGKTTLVRESLPDFDCVPLENPKAMANAQEDPKAFLDHHSGPVISDEIQGAPRLLGIEIKSSSTYHKSFKKGLLHFHDKVAPLARRYVVYNGERIAFSDGVEAIPAKQAHEIFGC